MTSFSPRNILGGLISPKLTVYCLAFLMVLTFWGTVYQVEHGLYEAQKVFFNSWYFTFAGFIPFPGTQLVLTVLLVNLTAYFVNMILTQPLKPGIVLIHAGVLMLLLGGAVTHHFAEESQLTLAEGQGSNVSASYNDWELSVWRQEGNVRNVLAVDADAFKPGDTVAFDEAGISVTVEKYFRNARAFRSPDEAGVINAMGITELREVKPELEPAGNVAGGIFAVRAASGSDEPVRLLLFGDDISPEPVTSGGTAYYVALRHKRFQLPMMITLLDFQREMHPGTGVAKSYSSRVEMQADAIDRELTISMNKPLRHNEYTLYQASFSQSHDGAETSTFAVARNYGRLVPYIATSVVVIGMLVHFLVMLVRKASRGTAAATALGIMLLAPGADAAITSCESFGRIPVQDGGRVMPMDSFARLRLLQISGRSTFGKESASAWLARVVFTPETATTDTVFLVNNPEVMEAIGVTPGHRRRFAFTEIEPGIQKLHEMAKKASDVDDKARSAVEKEILRVYENVNSFMALAQCFSFARPNADFMIDDEVVLSKLGLPAEAKAFSFYEIFRVAPKIAAEVESLSKTDQSTWTPTQRRLFALSATLYQWSQVYSGLPMAILPISGHEREAWVSPWDALSIGFVSEDLRNNMDSLVEMAGAYGEGRQLEFDMAAHRFERSARARAGESRSLTYADLELLYNTLDPFYRAEILYGFAFLLCLVFIMAERPAIRLGAMALVALAFVPHSFGLVSRMLIMGRPPVTNLFATFIFVSWICVVLGFILEWFQRNGLGLLLSSVAGLVLLMVAGRFSTQGDTLSVVVAVLDSNFWLSTHVVSITIGYAGCVAAGVAGHIYLLKALRYEPDSPQLKSAAGAVFGLLAFGLTFSFLGTMLGGVWADQSWGRFWGWDPKENGALLIVIWCTLLFHARISKMIGPLGMAAGSVLGVIVVLMAWLGINLLGVGLHSYGFTSGLARGLWISVAVEVLFVAVTVPLARRRAVIPG